MSLDFIAVLDHQHLENSLFLTSFAKSLAKLGDRKGLVVHGDSPYTDRLIQTGMMREDARMRAIKDLNKRLVGLFADQGIATIGIHGFQKSLMSWNNGKMVVDQESLKEFHASPNLLISNLIDQQGSAMYLSLPEFAQALSTQLDHVDILLFSKNEKDEIMASSGETRLNWDTLSAEFEEESLPEEFKNFGNKVKMTTASDFANWPKLQKVTIIE